MSITRRSFLTGATVTALSPCVAKAMMAAGGKDPNLSVFLSDLHASGENIARPNPQPTYQNPLLEKTVESILAMRPMPARVVVFGDLALWNGWDEDYQVSQSMLKRLVDVGIDLYVTTGNHDVRERMFKYYPKQREITPVPDRFVSVIDLGSADLLLLDSLYAKSREDGYGNFVGGTIDDAQWEWLSQEVKNRPRPFFVGAHHAPRDLNGRPMSKMLASTKNFVGWIHGHNHIWASDWFIENYGSRRIFRRVSLPSTGWWGDIGFTTMHTGVDRAELKLFQNDFFFPRPLKPGEPRPELWDAMMEEHRDRKCTFFY